MGNKGSSTREQPDSVYTSHSVQKKSSSEHQSLRSFLSVDSQQSTYSVSRPWSRVSRRRWHESTLTLPYESCKTAWPVSQSESLFLPDFPVKDYHKDNKFQKLPHISSGAFGKIYQIKDLDKNEIFALKVLSKSKIIENNLVKQVIEEAQIQRACGHHPFITKCFFNWQSRKHLYIASEFVEGGELWCLLSNLGALPVEIVQLYVCQIALALDFLHNAGVIYRDLKPENVLLDGDANVKLIDFGLSKWLPLGNVTRTVCGTPKYMAPEILEMKPYGHEVDWWSLGVTACLMLSGKLPAIEMISLPDEPPTTHLQMPKNASITMSSRDLLLRLLEVQPKKRIKSLRALGNIAFYKGYNFEHVKEKRYKAKDLLVKHFGEDYMKERDLAHDFDDFDEVLILDDDDENDVDE